MELSTLLWGLPVIVLAKLWFSNTPDKIRGVYSQPGPWYHVKFWVFYVLLKLRERKSKQQQTISENQVGFGAKSRSSEADMDKVQPLPAQHPKAVDAVYFNGASQDGQYFVGATARRHDRLTQTLLYIKFPDLGLLEIPLKPDTAQYRKEELTYEGGGFQIKAVEPMKKWNLSYDGKLRLMRPGKEPELVDTKFDLEWVADSKYFDFDTDLHPYTLCAATAREPWSREFFDKLRESHQTHYEQFGTVSGTVHVGKYGDKQLKVRGVRDHSYGNIRDWAHLHRYTLQYFVSGDGTAYCIGVICMSITLTRLVIGYVFHPDGRLDTVSECDLDLWEVGEDGDDPDDMEINFKAGGKNYNVQIHVTDRPHFYMGLQWEARVVERMCKFKVNGQEAWGVSEWEYRNRTGRPEKYSK